MNTRKSGKKWSLQGKLIIDPWVEEVKIEMFIEPTIWDSE